MTMCLETKESGPYGRLFQSSRLEWSCSRVVRVSHRGLAMRTGNELRKAGQSKSNSNDLEST
jgi:hypothetical protein